MSRTLKLLAALLIATAGFLLLRHYRSDPSKNGTEVNGQMATTNNVTNLHEWREFSSDTGRFKVLLPTLPQHVTDMYADPKTREQRKYETFVAAGDNGAAFMISAITFPNNLDADNGEETLKSAVADMLARNKDNKLNKMEVGKFRNQKAIDFSLSNSDLKIVGKVFSHNNILYILSMINKDSTFNGKEFDFFINSFDFVDNTRAPNGAKK